MQLYLDFNCETVIDGIKEQKQDKGRAHGVAVRVEFFTKKDDNRPEQAGVC